MPEGRGSGEQTVQRPRAREGTREGRPPELPRAKTESFRHQGPTGRGWERASGVGTDCPEQGKSADRFRSQGKSLGVLSPWRRAGRPGRAEGLRASSTTPPTQDNAPRGPGSLHSFSDPRA